MQLYRRGDSRRANDIEFDDRAEALERGYRSPFRRDYARLLHAPCFRRLQGKLQLFPGIENDFFRNRLTHSLEVAQIGKIIALKINAKNPSFRSSRGSGHEIDVDLIELACLAHDLGHPPFGHTGEEALDTCMKDLGGFEGNAQTLRILSRLEKKGAAHEPFNDGKDVRFGLNLTSRSLASILKYDRPIPRLTQDRTRPDKVQKGFYLSEAMVVERLKRDVLGTQRKSVRSGEFKSIECQIMDVADDIAYSTYDLEDALKGGIVSPQDFWAATLNKSLLERIASKIRAAGDSEFAGITAADVGMLLDAMIKLYFMPEGGRLAKRKRRNIVETGAAYYEWSRRLANDGYFRSRFTSGLVKEFLDGIEVEYNAACPALSIVRLESVTRAFVEVLKHFTYQQVIMSPRLRVVHYRGKGIVTALFEALMENDGHQLMPDDFRMCFELAPNDGCTRERVVCDFIAGMTDRYAVEFYARLKSESPQTIFKPF